MLDESLQKQGLQICHHLGLKCSCELTRSAEGGEGRNVKMSSYLVSISDSMGQYDSKRYII